MRSELSRSLCCVAAASVLIAMAGCGAREVKADVKETTSAITTIVISTNSEETQETAITETSAAETTVPETTAAETSVSSSEGTLKESGKVNGLYYHLIPASSSGSSGRRGYFIFQDRQDKLSYKICIAAGEFSTGGHDIKITDIQYDGSKLKITVKETSPAPTDYVTEAITYPCCAVEIDQLPGEIEIVSQKGAEFDCIDTQLDASEIGKDWIARIQNGAGERMRSTYVYELPDGKYKFINVQSTTKNWGSSRWNHVVKGRGTVDSREAVVEEAKKFGSCGFVSFAGDASKKVHSVAEFLAAKK